MPHTIVSYSVFGHRSAAPGISDPPFLLWLQYPTEDGELDGVSGNDYVIYCNDSLFFILRIHELLYSRLQVAKR